MDPDEVRQLRDYIHGQMLRRECLVLLLEMGEMRQQTFDLFCTGEEPWQLAILPGSPELN